MQGLVTPKTRHYTLEKYLPVIAITTAVAVAIVLVSFFGA